MGCPGGWSEQFHRRKRVLSFLVRIRKQHSDDLVVCDRIRVFCQIFGIISTAFIKGRLVAREWSNGDFIVTNKQHAKVTF